jgi:predicted transcriptional regulator
MQMQNTRLRAKSKSLALRLSERLATRLSDAAQAEDRTVAEFVREAVRRALDARGVNHFSQLTTGGGPANASERTR